MASEVMDSEALLKVNYLTVDIGRARIVDGVSFDIGRNQCVGIVGESGSGKSTLALALVGLVGDNNSASIDGEIHFNGRRIDQLSSHDLRELRGRDIAVILQDPMSSLNPVFTLGNQLAEAIRCHQQLKGDELQQQMLEALRAVHIAEPEQRLKSYPHQLSGGMRQRVVGAMAIACQPQLLIADEPTTSLDATLQAQYLKLLRELQQQAAQSQRPMSILLISHDFGAVAELCDRVCVMYAGTLVEIAEVTALFDRAAHPYTAALMRSRPQLQQKVSRLPSIPGSPPKPGEVKMGCGFASRCPQVSDQCRSEKPPLNFISDDHQVACWHPLNVSGVHNAVGAGHG